LLKTPMGRGNFVGGVSGKGDSLVVIPRPHKAIHGGTLQGEPTTAVCSLEALPAVQ